MSDVPNLLADGIADPTALPEWLPPAIRDWIAEQTRQGFHTDHLDKIPIVWSLATDERLRPLWNELRKRKPQGYYHPARRQVLESRCGCNLPEADEPLQALGLTHLFHGLVRIVAEARVVAMWTPDQRDAHVTGLLERARWLRAEADDTHKLGETWAAPADGMRAKALLLEELARALNEDATFVAAYERTNPKGVLAAGRAATLLNDLFGSPFYKQAALLGEIATADGVTADQAREAFRLLNKTRGDLPPASAVKSHQ